MKKKIYKGIVKNIRFSALSKKAPAKPTYMKEFGQQAKVAPVQLSIHWSIPGKEGKYMNNNIERKLSSKAYAIDEAIYIDAVKVPEDYTTESIKNILAGASLPADTEIREPYFSNIRIVSRIPSANEGEVIYHVFNDFQGIWNTNIYRMLRALFGDECVRIGVTDKPFPDVVEQKESYLKEIREQIHRYDEAIDLFGVFQAYGFNKTEAADIVKLQALLNISESIGDIARDVMDENAEKLLQALR